MASTLTTVLVFAPILFIEEEAGQLYSDIAVAISASILASMIVAITLVPTAAARLQMAENRPEPGRAVRQQVARCVAWLVATRTRRWAYLAGLTALVVGVLVFLTPPAEYLPEGEEPKLFARMIAPPGYNLDEMSTIADDVQAKLMPYVDDDPERYARGEADVPALAYINLSVEAGSLRIITETIRPSQIDALIPILSDLYESYPGMRAFVSRGSIITSNDGGTRSVNVDISGAELADIYAAAEQVYNRAREVLDDPQIGSQPSSLTLNQPLVEVRPDWLRVAELGLSAEELGFAVAALSDGAFVDEYFVGDDKVDIYLYSQAGNAQDLSALPELPIATAAGIVPISAVATLIDTVDTDEIRRVNGQRTVTLNIIAPRAVALETAVEIIRDDVIDQLNRSGQLPAGVVLDISGAADQLDATREALSGNFVVSLILCYLLLVAIFTHWGYPFVIMTIVPLGVAGGIGGLVLLNLLTRQPFDMISMLGFLILLGTVVNNPILIVDRTLQNLRDGQTSPQQAVTEAVDARLRPIMMSMITTVAGLSPLVFIPGAGTELYRGVGVIVLAGLVFSTVVTVTLLPVLLTTVLSLRRSPPGAAA